MKDRKWWQEAVFYQIYPRSFADCDGDGIGDLAGMIAKLDYLHALGVDAIWLSPHYPSPYVDCGYDIADYCNVDPLYGSLEEFNLFLDGLHKRGMRLILDLVLNHTSNKHPWFLESRSSVDNPKRDWYIWKKGDENAPPNDWYSTFGGSAWEYDPETCEYYYHYFFKEQPDLNWHNPQVKEAMFDAARFWLNMGVDGFRLDAIGTIFEEEGFPPHKQIYSLDDLYVWNRKAITLEDKNSVKEKWFCLFQHQLDQAGIHELMRELRMVIDEYPDKVLIGETDDLSYYGNGQNELHLVFNFPLMYTDQLTPLHIRENQKQRFAKIPEGGWPCNTLGNHDSPRVFSRFGDGLHNEELARLNLLLLLTLKGTPFLYNGEEIGMSNLILTDPVDFRDPLSTHIMELEHRLLSASLKDSVMAGVQEGRDKGRSPMQWRNDINGGFSPEGVKPWMPVNQDYEWGINVEDQEKKPDSLLHFYRQVLHIRRESPVLRRGDYSLLQVDPPNLLGFKRAIRDQCLEVWLNYGESELILPELIITRRVVVSTHKEIGTILCGGKNTIAPFEGLVLEIG